MEKYKTCEELYPITYNQLIKRENIDMGEEKKCCCSKTTSRSEEQKTAEQIKKDRRTGTRTSDNDRK